jgi:Amt family ammonium transporter
MINFNKLFISLVFCIFPTFAWASDREIVNSLWVIITTMIGMFTLPGIALFYGGMVKRPNILISFAQVFVCFIISCMVWIIIGYSLVYTSGSGYLGSLDKVLLRNIGLGVVFQNNIYEIAFVFRGAIFCSIAASIALVGVADRLKFNQMIVFLLIWLFLVNLPITHWVWGPEGFIGGQNKSDNVGLMGFGYSYDFAGALPIHICPGYTVLMVAFYLGYRNISGKEENPLYNMSFSAIGGFLMIIGLFSMNLGGDLLFNKKASLILVNNLASLSSSAIIWTAMEWKNYGRPTIKSMMFGGIGGLVAASGANGLIDVDKAILLGILTGLIGNKAMRVGKSKMEYDVQLVEIWAVHGICGIVGIIFTGIFASKGIGGVAGAIEGDYFKPFSQLCACITVVVYSYMVTMFIFRFINWSFKTNLRVTKEFEQDAEFYENCGEKIE